jgi:hypothetical protein
VTGRSFGSGRDPAAYVLGGQPLWLDGKAQQLDDEPVIEGISTSGFSQFDVDEGRNGLGTQVICVWC